MKTSKRLSALLLAVCLVLTMFVPAVYAEGEDLKTVNYDFDFCGIVTGLGQSIASNGLNNEKCTEQINSLYEAGHINWNYKAYTFENPAYPNFTVDGYFRGRNVVGDWVALSLDNPGEGTWALSMDYLATISGAQQVNVYILPGSVTEIGTSLTNEYLVGSYNCYDTGCTTDTPSSTKGKLIYKTSELNQWTAGSEAENPTYTLVFQAAQENGSNKAATGVTGKLAANIMFCGLNMTEVKVQPSEVKYDLDFVGIVLGLDQKVASNGLNKDACLEQINSLHEAGHINWNYKAYSFTNPDHAAFTGSANFEGYFRGRAVVGDWVALSLDNPGEGTWTLSVDYLSTISGAQEVKVYMLPGSVTEIATSLTDEYLVGSYNCYDKSCSTDTPTDTKGVLLYNTKELSKWTAGSEAENPTYTLVFQAAQENGSNKAATGVTGKLAANIQFCGLTMTAATAEEDIKITVDPITGEIAAEDAVTSINCLLAEADEVNGQDYVYLFFNGNKMYVYNLDTGKIIDKESNCFGTPRSVYIDESHIVWVTGANGKLYRYDPIAQSGEMINMEGVNLFPNAGSFNAFGLTGDGQGNLYFGTYNTAYLGKYNIETNTFSRIGEWLCAPGYEQDAVRAGDAGLIYKDGYIYIGIDGNKNNDGVDTHQILKVDVTTGTVVDFVDISTQIDGNSYLDEMTLVGDVILASSANGKVTKGSIAIDISGEQMKRIDVPGLENGFSGAISPEINGKVYMMSNSGKGLLEYDIAQRKITAENVMSDKGTLKFHDCYVTLEGNDQMPGNSLLTFVSGVSNRVDLVLYNLQTKNTVVLEDVTEGLGSGNQLRALEVSPDGKTVYVSSYGWNHLSVYDVESGKVLVQYPTINTQIESIICYEGEVYIGNYSSCTVSRIDVETGAYMRMIQLGNSVFSQHRLHATAAGDGKVFFGTAPSKNRLGGTMIWYDIENDRCYVAAGPNPEDVYYTPSGESKGGETGNVSSQEWYSALTGEKVLTDADSIDIKDENGKTVQRFTGVVKEQTINSLVYQDGYIYGSTSRAGGSGANYDHVGNACLFVYDVAAMKVVDTYDLTKAIDGLKTDVPVEFIDGIAADPDVPGKFWGVVSDTLFSFTYDAEKGFTVTTELSMGTTAYNHGNNLHQDRSILFDGDFMYVAFGSYGTYMIKRDEPQVNFKISDAIPKQMVQAADGNLYYHDSTTDLKVLKIADTAKTVKDAYGVQKAQDMIDALDAADQITLDDEAAVNAARKAYDSLSEEAKAKVNAEKLIAAEAAVKPLREAADKAAADAVIAQITAIGEVTLEDENAIKAAREAYNALTASQKALVTNAADLTAAEEKLADMKTPEADKQMAAAADAKIEAIGTVTRYSAEAIEAARAAYDNLTAEQKVLVKNLSVLTAAEAEYAAIIAELTNLYNFDYINSGLTYKGNSLFSEEKLLMYMRQHYANGENNYDLKDIVFAHEGSNDASFNGVGYLQLRTVPGDYIAFTIKNPGEGTYDLSISYVASFCGAEEVAVYIIPADTEDIGAALKDEYLVGVYSCYDASVQAEKPTIDTKRSSALGTWNAGSAEEYILVYKCAKASEESLANIPVRQANGETVRDYGSNTYACQLTMVKADADVVAVQEMIDAIGEVTLNSEEAIKAARAAYDALSDGQKASVDITALTAAEAKLAELKKEAADKAAADAVTAQIEAIGTVTLESEEAIEAARAAYEALTADQKKLVDETALTAAETKLAELQAAAEKEAADKAAAGVVQAMINNIGTVTLESEETITNARTAYEALTADQKKLVDSEKLVAAEAKLDELKLEAEKEAADKAAADAVIAKIDAIGTVTLESKAAISAARAAYEALTAEQKALVTNVNVLTAAEASLAALENPKTGDMAPAAILAGILIASAAALAVLLIDNKKKFANR